MTNQNHKYLTYDEIAKIFRLAGGAASARNLYSAGKPMPPSIRIGRRRLFREDLVYEWLESQSEKNGSEG